MAKSKPKSFDLTVGVPILVQMITFPMFSQTTHSREVFFLSERKKQSSNNILFQLMYLLFTYSQFPDCQCIPCLGFLCVLQKLQIQ
ncbi:hypothetical protein DV515_00003522 [Chloebia gouldiae]|uniref:Uncharacterized protein n=1 Tax=Chloebia gouldiae TaxID=44316 RepID=A0A3L8SU23_CHLGU|nr:hypothetical protein DV515_00003522 [Chloebia gouldiae]